jgi:hypothetical protein
VVIGLSLVMGAVLGLMDFILNSLYGLTLR